MIAHPEIFDMIAEPELLSLTQTIEEKEKTFKANLELINSFEKKLVYLRKERKLNVILVGINDLLDIIDWEEASKRLSELARTLVKIVFELVEENYKIKYGIPQSSQERKSDKHSRFCLIALGKIGGNEITYHSDLDIISVYSGEGNTNGENSIDIFTYYSKLTTDVINALSDMGEEGYIYKVDARLRPEGKSSPITAPVERYYDYYENKAMLWEYQSFLKADYLAGDKSLANEFISNIRKIIIQNVGKFNIQSDILYMRKRLEEKEKLPDWALSDIKNGKGGISDIDFIIQYLQLKHCNSYPDIFEANTLEELEKLFKLNILNEPS
jgi:glutamate-ammonia-ligase adenylyltransferase